MIFLSGLLREASPERDTLFQVYERVGASGLVEVRNRVGKSVASICKKAQSVYRFILLHEKFLQFDWLRAVVFQLNLKYLHVKITTLLWVVV